MRKLLSITYILIAIIITVFLLRFDIEIAVFAVIVSVISIIPLVFLYKGRSVFDYLIVCIPYIMVTGRFLFLPVLPIWDSWSYHFPMFKYIGDTIANGHLFPEWFPVSGGVRIGFFHIQVFSTIPHRILGYLLYIILPISPVFIYKLQYILGIIFMCFGWWIVLKKITHCHYASCFGTLMIMMGGTGITFHQEQVLATTYLIPWFVLSLLKMRENSFYVFPSIVLFGLGLNTHNTQIQFISMGLIVLLIIIYHPQLIKTVFHEQRRFALLLLFLFVLSILPSLYLFYNTSDLATSVRKTVEYFHPKTYEEYLSLSIGNFSSAPLSYYNQYIKPIVDTANNVQGVLMDRCAFFVGRIALILVVLAVLSKPLWSMPVLFLLTTFILLTLGVNSIIPIPKYLYYLRFPFIDVFRQWYHFFPMVNYCLSALAAVGISYFSRYSSRKTHTIFSISIFLILFLQITDLSVYGLKYCSTFYRKDIPGEISDTLFSREICPPADLFHYRNRFKLCRLCPQAIPLEPVLTNDIITVTDGYIAELEEICNIVKGGKSSVAANIAPQVLQDYFPPYKSLNKFKKTVNFNSVRYDKLFWDVELSEPALFVIPLNYNLGLKAIVDGKEAEVWRVNSALSGILLREGNHHIKLKVASDIYLLIIIIQVLLYVFLGLFPFLLKLSKYNF